MASLSALVVAKRESAPAPAAPPAPPQARRRRNQPGNPSPDAEVVALSPTTLMATNRFICEVCNKGFQREQNLQLHRRGHNLPWKLKQRSTTAPRRKVYLCPEPNCIHHHPTRALGDLTGIKKHYSRKHGEKKFKCEKCAKKYAVQSDWKAHMKTCGTREYRCDCGTLFSRRDSFITHRAFCDALAQETAGRTPFVGLGTGLFSGGSTNMLSHSSHQQIAGATAPSAFRSLLASSSSTYRPHMGASSSFFQLPETQDFRLKAVAPPMMHGGGHGLQSHSGGSSSGAAQPGVFNMSHSGGSSSGAAALAPGMFNYGSYFPSNNRSNSGGDSGGVDSSSNVTFPMSGHFNITNQFSDGGSSFFAAAAPPHLVGGHMSATALLQQAAMIGSTSSTISASLLRTFNSHPAKLEHGHHQLYSQDYSPFGSILDPQSTYYPPSYTNVGPPPGFGSLRRSSSSERGGASSSSRLNVVGEGLTRDFLGMRAAAAAAAAAAASGGDETSGGAADRKDVRAPPVKGVGGIRFKQ